jgi:hypothetical protein
LLLYALKLFLLLLALLLNIELGFMDMLLEFVEPFLMFAEDDRLAVWITEGVRWGAC